MKTNRAKKIQNLKAQAEKAYGKMLNERPWDYYLTLTTRYELTQKSARRAAERFFAKIDKEYGGSVFFWASEPFDVKEGFHIHGLIYLKNRELAKTKTGFDLLRKLWRRVSKGNNGFENTFTKIEEFKPSGGASDYVSKYISFDMSDYDILI